MTSPRDDEWEALGFDPTADLTEEIRECLTHPTWEHRTQMLGVRWPWVPPKTRQRYATEAATSLGADLNWLVKRYQDVVRTEWYERYDRAPVGVSWWRRFIDWWRP